MRRIARPSRAALIRYAAFQVPGWGLAGVLSFAAWEWFGVPAWAAWGALGLWVAKDAVMARFVAHAYEGHARGGPHDLVLRNSASLSDTYAYKLNNVDSAEGWGLSGINDRVYYSSHAFFAMIACQDGANCDNVTAATEVHLKAGDAILFTDAISHGSAARMQPRWRTSRLSAKKSAWRSKSQTTCSTPIASA